MKTLPKPLEHVEGAHGISNAHQHTNDVSVEIIDDGAMETNRSM